MKAILAVLAVIGMAVCANEASANGGVFQRQVVVRRVVQQPVVRVVHQPVVVRQQVHAVNAGCFGGGYGVQSFAAPCGVNSLGYGNAFNSFGYGNAFGFQRQRFVNGSLFSPFGFNRGFGRGLSLNFGF